MKHHNSTTRFPNASIPCFLSPLSYSPLPTTLILYYTVQKTDQFLKVYHAIPLMIDEMKETFRKLVVQWPIKHFISQFLFILNLCFFFSFTGLNYHCSIFFLFLFFFLSYHSLNVPATNWANCTASNPESLLYRTGDPAAYWTHRCLSSRVATSANQLKFYSCAWIKFKFYLYVLK